MGPLVHDPYAPPRAHRTHQDPDVSFRCCAQVVPPKKTKSRQAMTSEHFTTTVTLLPCLRLESMLPIPVEFQASVWV